MVERMRAAAWVGLIVAALAAPARAQVASDGFGIERFHPGIDSAALLDVDSAEVPGHGSWSAGVWTGFAHDPLVIYDHQMNAVEPLVRRRLTTGLVGSLALWNRLELALDADVIGYQSGAADSPTMKPLPGGGLGDLGLVAKAVLVRGDAYAIAFEPAFTVPLGGATGYLREAGPTFAPALAVSGASGRVRGAANVGYLFRKRVATAGLVVDDEVYARAGLGVAVGGDAELTWSASVASPTHDASRNLIAVETLVGAARPVTGAIGVFAAGGLGLDNGYGTPDWRAVLGVRYAEVRGARPRIEADSDGDGIADDRDRCPHAAEDKDGFQDADGCPDLDNDGDGIPDASDRCPNQAEDKDGFQDADGCPDAPTQLAGQVVDKDGRAIAHANVTIEQLEVRGKPPIELVAGDDGAFATTLDGGNLKVTARAPDYQPGTTDLRVTPGTPATVEVKLVRAVREGQLRGQVLAFDGKPIAATISVTGKQTATVTADTDGRYTLDLPEGSYEVVIEAPGHVTQRRSVSVKLDGVTVLNVDLRGAR